MRRSPFVLTLVAVAATGCSGDGDEAVPTTGGAYPTTAFEDAATTTVAAPPDEREEDVAAEVTESAAEETVAAASDTTGVAAPADAGEGVVTSPPAGTPLPVPLPEPAPAPAPAFAPFTDTSLDAESTFALDVDTGSYSYARGQLENGFLPDPTTVRAEEFVNAFDHAYAHPIDGVFDVDVDAVSSPFEADTYFLRVGIAARDVQGEHGRAAVTLVVDVSGSMDEPSPSGDRKMDVVKRALDVVVEALHDDDRIAIVTFSETAALYVEPTVVGESRARLHEAIAMLEPTDSTSVEAGLALAYQVEDDFRLGEGADRVILLSDGIANTDATTAEGILAGAAEWAGRDVFLTTVGVGLHASDPLLEQLADQGDGVYRFVDSAAAAEEVFATDLLATLVTVAADAKVQVIFDPDVVLEYRLVGYENRSIADEDFENPAVDAGEVNAGHEVTAVYEVRLGERTADAAVTVRLRYVDVATGEEDEAAWSVPGDVLAEAIVSSPGDLVRDVAVVQFARALGGGGADPHSLLEFVEQTAGRWPASEESTELASLIARWATLAGCEYGCPIPFVGTESAWPESNW